MKHDIILGSVLSEHIGFVDFIINLGPGIVVMSPLVFLVIRIVSYLCLLLDDCLTAQLFRNQLENKPCHDSIIGISYLSFCPQTY